MTFIDNLNELEKYPWFSNWLFSSDDISSHFNGLTTESFPGFWIAGSYKNEVQVELADLEGATKYPFLGFDICLLSGENIVFSLGGRVLWWFNFYGGNIKVEDLLKAFQLSSLGGMCLEDAFSQVFSDTESSFSYDTSKSVISNYNNYKVTTKSNRADVLQALAELGLFLGRRVNELATLSQFDFSYTPEVWIGKYRVSESIRKKIQQFPFFLPALSYKRDVFSKYAIIFPSEFLKSKSLAIVLSNNSTYSELTLDQYKVLNALELTRQSSKSAFLYDWLRLKDGGENFGGENVPDPYEVLTQVGLDKILGDDCIKSQSSKTMQELEPEITDALIYPPETDKYTEEQKKVFDPVFINRYNSLMGFWRRFLKI